MGDRVVFTIKQDKDLSVNLYSHWGGYDRFIDLARALRAAEPRWNDTSYATRIIVIVTGKQINLYLALY